MRLTPSKFAALLCAYVLILHSFNAAAGGNEEFPPEIVSAIDSAKSLCGAETFIFNPEYLSETDLNADGFSDYILSSQAFDCKDMALYGGSAGYSHSIFVSQEDGSLSEVENVLAYGHEVDDAVSPPQVVFQTRCLMQGTETGTSRYQWQDGRMKLVSSTLNCPKPDGQ